VKSVQLESDITAWRSGAPICDVADGGGRSPNGRTDVSQPHAAGLKVSNCRCPVHADILPVRDVVLQALQHPVTEFRHDRGMTVGARIKGRLAEIGKSVKWLSARTKIPVTTLYDLIRGDITSTPRLPTIAEALGVRAVWLERDTGPKLAVSTESALSPSKPEEDPWPFKFDRERFDRLSSDDKNKVEGAALMVILEIEGHQNAARKRRKAG
jgi:hypothetical protein